MNNPNFAILLEKMSNLEMSKLTKEAEIKVRLKKNHPEIHKDSKKLVGILRQIKIKRNMGIVFFPFLNERFVIPLSDLKEIKNE